MTRLIVCCDGTWNTPGQTEDGLPAVTNVIKFRNALAAAGAGGERQDVYYHAGVGTDGGLWNRLVGGGLGEGLDDRIKSAYRWLARSWRPGDRVHLIGFSRGAYTARSVGGMIGRCGLPDLTPESGVGSADGWRRVEAYFAMYRRKKGEPGSAPPDAERRSVGIDFIGVWDTVGALGIPDDFAFLNLIDDPQRHAFHDTELSDAVKCARHALALDERRQAFSPTLWTRVAPGRDVKQVWFPGVHGDVGGGYANSDLSDGSLGWMIDEAAAIGVGFKPGVQALLKPMPQGLMHDSLTGIFAKLKKRPRPVPNVVKGDTALHESVVKRLDMVSLDHEAYWMARALAAGAGVELDVFARDPWNYTGLYLEEGVEYEFRADGEWLDRTIACGPEGMDDDRFQVEELIYLGAGLIDKAEDVFRRLSRNDKAELWWSRRDGHAPWFCLMGAIANGARDGDHEVFAIGQGKTYRPEKSGYLWCFPNDAWEAYDNNRGSVSLTVRVVAAATPPAMAAAMVPAH